MKFELACILYRLIVMSLLQSQAQKSVEKKESARVPLRQRSSAKGRSMAAAALSAALLSPLLVSATSGPAMEDSISATCSLEETSSHSAEPTQNANVSHRRGLNRASNARPSTISEAGLATFVRDRWNSVRRLVRENPYFTGATPEEQARAEALCLAHIQADDQWLIAQASESDPAALPDLSSSSESTGESIGESSGEFLPDSFPTNSTPSVSPDSSTPAASSPSPEPNGALINPEPDGTALSNPGLRNQLSNPQINPQISDQPLQHPVPSRSLAADPATLPTAQDPSMYMGPEFEPTPFDGTVIRTLADMPDGNYRYISGNVEERAYSNEELQQRDGSIFILKKVGDTVVGNLLPKVGLPGICVTGTVSGNTISGAAYPDGAAGNSPESVGQIGEKYEFHGNTALKVRQISTEEDRLYYADALLDLAAFTPINAGSSLPPTSCQRDHVDSGT